MEQVMGIEPTCSAWEADILPLNYTCVRNIVTQFSSRRKYFFGKILPKGVSFFSPPKSRGPSPRTGPSLLYSSSPARRKNSPWVRPSGTAPGALPSLAVRSVLTSSPVAGESQSILSPWGAMAPARTAASSGPA